MWEKERKALLDFWMKKFEQEKEAKEHLLKLLHKEPTVSINVDELTNVLGAEPRVRRIQGADNHKGQRYQIELGTSEDLDHEAEFYKAIITVTVGHDLEELEVKPAVSVVDEETAPSGTQAEAETAVDHSLESDANLTDTAVENLSTEREILNETVSAVEASLSVLNAALDTVSGAPALKADFPQVIKNKKKRKNKKAAKLIIRSTQQVQEPTETQTAEASEDLDHEAEFYKAINTVTVGHDLEELEVKPAVSVVDEETAPSGTQAEAETAVDHSLESDAYLTDTAVENLSTEREILNETVSAVEAPLSVPNAALDTVSGAPAQVIKNKKKRKNEKAAKLTIRNTLQVQEPTETQTAKVLPDAVVKPQDTQTPHMKPVESSAETRVQDEDTIVKEVSPLKMEECPCSDVMDMMAVTTHGLSVRKTKLLKKKNLNLQCAESSTTENKLNVAKEAQQAAAKAPQPPADVQPATAEAHMCGGKQHTALAKVWKKRSNGEMGRGEVRGVGRLCLYPTRFESRQGSALMKLIMDLCECNGKAPLSKSCLVEV
uniref:Uncharacterized protein n=1 Tax=Knipowitschia caucasica TaxID=637954 RepID=A0AAV2KQC1_KNICA